MSTFSKSSRCLKTFRNLHFIQENNQPDLDSMRVHILDCLNALLFMEGKELIETNNASNARHIENTNGKVRSIKESEELAEARHQVFIMALLMSLEYGGNFDTAVSNEVYVKKQLLEAFPDDAKLSDCRGWLPLHWAVAASASWELSLPGLCFDDIILDYDIVKTIYNADTSALEKHHLQICGDNCDDMVGYTPLHFLCLELSPNKELIDYFALKSPASFAIMTSHVHIRRPAKLFTGESISTMSTGSCLHLVAKHNLYTDDVIQSIIKAAPQMIVAKGFSYDTPLAGLCGRYGVTDCVGDDDVFYSMFYSLLEANFSVTVIESPHVAMLLRDRTFVFKLLKGCFRATDPSLGNFEGAENALEIVGILLNSNPEVAEMHTPSHKSLLVYQTSPEQNLLQVAASNLKGEVGAEIMEELLVVCDDHKSSNDFRTRKWYAVEFAAKSSTAEVLEVLVDSYLYSPPQHNLKSRPRVNLRDSKGDMEHFGLNLIDLALLEIDEDNADVTIQKIVLLHEYDGKVLLRRNSDGEIPLHYMIRKFKMKHLNEELGNSYFKVIQAMCMLSPNIVKYKMEDMVPLLVLLKNSKHLGGKWSPVSGFADCFRLFLHLYPTAAGEYDSAGNNCQMFLRSSNWDSYFYRYLMKNSVLAPMQHVSIANNLTQYCNGIALRNLIYKDRRVALFLAYGNIKYGHDLGYTQESILIRLRVEHSDLIRTVIMFL